LSLAAGACLLIALAPPAAAQDPAHPQHACGAQPDSTASETAGRLWLACENNYWAAVYRASLKLSRYSDIEPACLSQYAGAFETAAEHYSRGEWAEAAAAKSAVTCAAGHHPKIDAGALAMLCPDARWTPENLGHVDCFRTGDTDEKVSVTTWVEEFGSGRLIQMKNNSVDRPVRITSWTVYACENIRSEMCTTHTKGPVLRPLETLMLANVQPASIGAGWSFQYRYEAEFLH
jgi:hypothetical protein